MSGQHTKQQRHAPHITLSAQLRICQLSACRAHTVSCQGTDVKLSLSHTHTLTHTPCPLLASSVSAQVIVGGRPRLWYDRARGCGTMSARALCVACTTLHGKAHHTTPTKACMRRGMRATCGAQETLRAMTELLPKALDVMQRCPACRWMNAHARALRLQDFTHIMALFVGDVSKQCNDHPAAGAGQHTSSS